MINSLTNVPNDELKYHQDNPDFTETVLDRLASTEDELQDVVKKHDKFAFEVEEVSIAIDNSWTELSELFDDFELDDTLTKERFFKRLNSICSKMQPAIDDLTTLDGEI